jgi:hypothetical protein
MRGFGPVPDNVPFAAIAPTMNNPAVPANGAAAGRKARIRETGRPCLRRTVGPDRISLAFRMPLAAAPARSRRQACAYNIPGIKR